MYCSLQQKKKTTDRFGNLMELYEQNYVLLRLLIPDLKTAEVGARVSKVDDCLPVYMQVLEQSPYTSTLRLTYRFIERYADSPDSNSADSNLADSKLASGVSRLAVRALAEPDLMLRVYHDARTAEVVSGLIHGQQRERKTRGLDSSWHLNRFLYKWLKYLRYRGHRLSEIKKENTEERQL